MSEIANEILKVASKAVKEAQKRIRKWYCQCLQQKWKNIFPTP
jgi:hypothetical protein